MPELPEVETIRLQLSEKIVGLKLVNFEFDTPKIFSGEKKSLLGKKILGLRRFAKVLVIDLEDDKSILIHLKMTGQLIYQKGAIRVAGGHPVPPLNLPVPNKTTHAIFTFNNGAKLYFNDLRKFGWVKLVDTGGLEIRELEREFSIEPLSSKFTLDYFSEKLQKYKNRPVKLAIMDQSLAPGVGNIYASEALFLAKLNPNRKVSSLTYQEIKQLYSGIKKALTTGLKYGGASAAAYVKPDSTLGVYLKYAAVYNREGEKCKRCGAQISKEKIGQRGTYFCPSCQK